ncbi:phage holin family protein [Streptomyces sp. NPDC006649]|uniref:phage holin family protein n=1 Tax=Streptomyces sp. NPDC006649 TaxID=3156896 RepID=UPI0033B590EF
MERNERPTTAAARWLVRTTATRYFALAGVFFVWAFIWLAWAPKPYAWIATVLWIVIAAVFAAQGLRLRRQVQATEGARNDGAAHRTDGSGGTDGPERTDGTDPAETPGDADRAEGTEDEQGGRGPGGG